MACRHQLLGGVVCSSRKNAFLTKPGNGSSLSSSSAPLSAGWSSVSSRTNRLCWSCWRKRNPPDRPSSPSKGWKRARDFRRLDGASDRDRLVRGCILGLLGDDDVLLRLPLDSSDMHHNSDQPRRTMVESAREDAPMPNQSLITDSLMALRLLDIRDPVSQRKPSCLTARELHF